MPRESTKSARETAEDGTKPPFLRRMRISGYKSIGFCDVEFNAMTVLTPEATENRQTVGNRHITRSGLRPSVRRRRQQNHHQDRRLNDGSLNGHCLGGDCSRTGSPVNGFVHGRIGGCHNMYSLRLSQPKKQPGQNRAKTIMASRTDVLRAERSAQDKGRYAPHSRLRCR
jgi:hypothetical protein